MSGTTTTVTTLPYCDECKQPMFGQGTLVPAYADAYSPSHHQWGYWCKRHFDASRCRLGEGRGQRLILIERDTVAEADHRKLSRLNADDTL